MTTHKHLFLAMLVFAAALVSGCFTLPGKIVFDPDLSPEESTVVVFGDSIHVKLYNGIDVNDKWYPDHKYRQQTVTLPAGQTTVIFDLWATYSSGNTVYSYRGNDIELRFDFEAEKKYAFGFYRESLGVESFLLGKYKWGVAIWEDSTVAASSSSSNTGGRSSDSSGATTSRTKNNALRSWELGES